MLLKTIIISTFLLVCTYYIDRVLDFSLYQVDSSSLGSFVTAFGTIYGVIVGFIVIEVWNQKNTIQKLIEKEAKDIEGLFNLVCDFRDEDLKEKLKKEILEYIDLVLKNHRMSLEQKRIKMEPIINNISGIIDTTEFDDDHDPIIFDHVINQFKEMRDTRTERIRESLARLPRPLQTFITLASVIMVVTTVIMPFDNIWYHLFSTFTITFFISLIHQIINDLNNPFIGYWSVGLSPFEELQKKITEI
ncbi:DUF4239 domain-containing protein [Candidatus Dojkabacteria bacterium]|nr:DUF4239 domain-containing protein [Candidatus Dojkabacteria bacterium]